MLPPVHGAFEDTSKKEYCHMLNISSFKKYTGQTGTDMERAGVPCIRCVYAAGYFIQCLQPHVFLAVS